MVLFYLIFPFGFTQPSSYNNHATISFCNLHSNLEPSTLSSSNNSIVTRTSRISCFSTFCKHTGGRTGMPSAICSTFTTTHRMSNGIHCLSSYVRSTSHVALPPGFTDSYILVVWITHLADCCPALLTNHPHFTAWQNDSNPIAFFCHNSCRVTGTSDKFSALAGSHFDIVNFQSGWNCRQRHC